MPAVPQEIIAAYAEIVRNSPNVDVAMAHLSNMLADTAKIAQTIQETIDAARQRAQQVGG